MAGPAETAIYRRTNRIPPYRPRRAKGCGHARTTRRLRSGTEVEAIRGMKQPCRFLMSRRFSPGLTLLVLFSLLLGTASPAVGADKFCSDPPYYGVIDGSIRPDPVQITIDMNCTFKNFPQSDPLTSTINFQTNDNSIYLIIFDNVYYTGNMACSNIDHRIWFSNSSYYGSNNACQDLFIPIEKIDKQSPAP